MHYSGKFDAKLPVDGVARDSMGHDHIEAFSAQATQIPAGAIIVPDAHLLFSGDYHKSGQDLIISDHLHRVVVPNYFHGDKRPALVSPEGAPLDPDVVIALTGHTEYAQAGGAPAAKLVGHVAKMTGSASVVRNGVTVDVQIGDAVYQSDVVQTGSGSTLGLVLSDGTTFNLSANARLMLNDLTYDATSISNSSLITLVQGAASFVVGQIAKTGDMQVATPVATLGIRGTAVNLDISTIDGKVLISVIDQRDGQVHAVEVRNARGDVIGTVTSNGTALTLTPTATFEVIAERSDKSPAQIAREFSAFQEVLNTYDVQKAIDPNLPQHTEGPKDANPQSTKYAGLGSTPVNPPQTDYHSALPSGSAGSGSTGGSGTPIFVTTQSPVGITTGGITPTQPPADPVLILNQILQPTPTPFVVSPSTLIKISTGSGDHFGPVMSADGQFVTYDPDGVIFLFDRKAGATITIATPAAGLGFSAPTISSDGRFVVYQRSDGVVFVYNNDSSDPTHYQHTTQIGSGTSPAISGDGSRILVENGGNIVVYDQQGHILTTITPAAAGVSGALWKPAVSADGHVFAFWGGDSANPQGSGQLHTYDRSTAIISSIASTAHGAGTIAASISADGHYAVYQSDAVGGHSEIYLYNLQTNQVIFHTSNAGGGSYNPVISPDGHFIIFASDARLTPDDTNSVADTYVVDVTNPSVPIFKLVSALADGTQGNAASNLGAAISAGGLFIAFGSNASNFSSSGGPGGGIFVVDPSSGRTAIIQEIASSPPTLTATGTITLTGDHTGTTISVSGDHPERFSASFDAKGNLSWSFSEAKSDFATLPYGQDASQQFVVTLHSSAGTTTIPVTVTVLNAIQPVSTLDHIPGPPTVYTTSSSMKELAGTTGSLESDLATGEIRWADINPGDVPSTTVKFASFTYKDAKGNDVTLDLNALQRADIQSVEVDLLVVHAGDNKNHGSATWIYSVPDHAFDFLAAGETLTLTYTAVVNNNFKPNEEKTAQSFTITITGTNDVPVIDTDPQFIALSGGTSKPGGNLSKAPISGTLAFTDVDLTDTHTVATKLTNASMSGPGAPTLNEAALDLLAPHPMALFADALSAKIAAGKDSTGTGHGTIDWKLADFPVYLADFIPKGETLTLTYTVTVTDSQNATATKTVTVAITGTDAPAVVWIDTTGPGGTPGGLWSGKANWETGTVPTATDDVIIITDQLIGLTPSYPVTISAPTTAKTLTINDFSATPAHLINNSTLTIGYAPSPSVPMVGGTFTLNNDSIVDNRAGATINVGGKMDLLDQVNPAVSLNHTVVRNFGTINLRQGGDFEGLSSITNTGMIEVQGGILNVGVDIANFAQVDVKKIQAGQIIVDPGATLALGTDPNNSSSITGGITGGTVTINGTLEFQGNNFLNSGTLTNTGQINVGGTGNALHAEMVTANQALEVLAGATLLMDQGTTVANGGTISVDGAILVGAVTTPAATLTLDHAIITGGTVTDGGTIYVTGDSAINSAALNNGKVTVDASKTLTLDGTTVTGTSFTDPGAIKVESGKTLTLAGTDSVTGGLLAIGGPLASFAEGGGVLLSGASAGATDGSNPVVTLSITASSGTLVPIAGSSLKVVGGLDGSNGTLKVTGTLSAVNTGFNSGLTYYPVGTSNTLTVTIDVGSGDSAFRTFTVDTSGASPFTHIVDSTGAIKNAGLIDITGTTTLTAAQVLNGSGTLKVESGALLKLAKSGTSGGTITNNGTIEIAARAGINGAALNIGAAGVLLVDSGQLLTLNKTTVTGGTVTDSGTIHVTGDSAINSAALNNGKVRVDASKTLTLDGTTVTGTTITDSGTVKVDATKQLNLSGVTLTGGAINNLGTVDITGDTTINSDAVANTQLTIDAAKTLTLNGTTVTGGTVTDSGTIHVTGNSAINSAALNNGQVTVDATKTLTLVGTTVTGTAIANSGTLRIETPHVGTSSVSTLDGVEFTNSGALIRVDAIFGGFGPPPAATMLVLDHGTKITGGTLSIGDIGVVKVQTAAGATLNKVAVTSLGAIQVDLAGVLFLESTTVMGGTLTNAGEIDILSGNNTLGGAVTNSGTMDVTGGTLTFAAGGSVTNSGTLEVNGGNLIFNSTLSGSATIIGASFLDLYASDAYSGANIVFASKSTGTLKLDHSKLFGGTIVGLDDNFLDLGDVTSGANTTVTYSSADGILTVVNNADITQTAHIHLAGNYLGVHWSVFSDSHGGTIVKEVPGVVAGLDAKGNAIEGQAVTASITDGGQVVTNAHYQWQLDGVNILNAANATYLPTEGDEGHALTVNISFVDALNWAESSSASAGTVGESPTENASISLSGLTGGNAVEGTQVTATVTEADAPALSAITYTWFASGTQVASGLGLNTFTPGKTIEGKALTVSVTFTDTHGFVETGTVGAGTVVAPASSNWSTLGSAVIATIHDSVTPSLGGYMAVLDSGSSSESAVENFLGLQSGALANLPTNGVKPTIGSAIQTTLVLKAGDKVTFDWDFIAHDYLPYDDFSFVSINGVASLLSDIVHVGNFGTTGWQTFSSYTAPVSGTFKIGMGQFNALDSALPSHLLIDNLRINGVSTNSFANGSFAGSTLFPAGTAGASIQLALPDPIRDSKGLVTLNLSGIASDWSLNEGKKNSDGSWTVLTSDPKSLAITPAISFSGAALIKVKETWVSGDGSTVSSTFNDNVEAYSLGSPIFALPSDDHLSSTGTGSFFVFAQPIGHDIISNFNVTSDKIDLIDFKNIISFADLQANLADDANGNAVVTLGVGETITLQGVHATSLTANDFLFNQAPVTQNAVQMTIGDGAILPLMGVLNNTGSIQLNSSGTMTDVELIGRDVALRGAGQIVLSDSSENVIGGSATNVVLTNVDNTISGAGQIGARQLTLINEGTINATGVNSLVIDTGVNAVANSGTLEATGKGGLIVHSDLVNTGVLWANGGNVALQGKVSGNGIAKIDGGGALDFESSSTTDVVFGSGAAGTLKLGDSFHFNGRISGFSGSDTIDLANLGTSAASISYHENLAGTGGTLAISEGTQTVELSLSGHYSANNFSVFPDQAKGTLVTYVPHVPVPHDLIV